MGLDIFFYRHKNTSAKIERALVKFYNEFNESMPASEARALAEKFGVADRVDVKENEYTNREGEPVTYTTAYRSDSEECGYMRKHNHLVTYFGYEDNCSDKRVSRGELEAFIDDAKEVLSHYWQGDFQEVAEDLIPCCQGFFFGSYDYDEWYKQELEEDIKIFQDIIETTDWNKDEVVMHCWW